MDAYFSERRNAAAARAFFERAIAETGLAPERIVTDHRARCYPPALRAVLPSVEHRCSRYSNNGLERDHGHLKGRLRPMRGFRSVASADTISRGHDALISVTYAMASGGSPPKSRHSCALQPLGHSWHERSSPPRRFFPCTDRPGRPCSLRMPTQLQQNRARSRVPPGALFIASFARCGPLRTPGELPCKTGPQAACRFYRRSRFSSSRANPIPYQTRS